MTSCGLTCDDLSQWQQASFPRWSVRFALSAFETGDSVTTAERGVPANVRASRPPTHAEALADIRLDGVPVFAPPRAATTAPMSSLSAHPRLVPRPESRREIRRGRPLRRRAERRSRRVRLECSLPNSREPLCPARGHCRASPDGRRPLPGLAVAYLPRPPPGRLPPAPAGPVRALPLPDGIRGPPIGRGSRAVTPARGHRARDRAPAAGLRRADATPRRTGPHHRTRQRSSVRPLRAFRRRGTLIRSRIPHDARCTIAPLGRIVMNNTDLVSTVATRAFITRATADSAVATVFPITASTSSPCSRPPR